MYILYCDLCNMPIKEGEYKHLLVIRPLKHLSESETNYAEEDNAYNDILSAIKNYKKEMVSYEICPKCKAVFDKFVKLRVNELKKLHKQLKPYEEDEVDGNA